MNTNQVVRKLTFAVTLMVSGATAFAQTTANPTPTNSTTDPATTQNPATQSQSSQPAPQVPAGLDASAAKARAIVDRMIKALGGDAYLSYTFKTEQGRSYGFFQGESRGTGTPYWRLWKYPDKERLELTKQRDIVYVHVADKGYELTYKGTTTEDPDVTADFIRRRDHSMEIVTREWLKNPKTVVLHTGTALVDGRLCDQISVINPNNDSVTLSVDQNTNLPAQKSFTYRDKDRYKVEEGEVYGNYRQVDGIMTPYTFTRMKDGLMQTQRFINDVDYKTEIPDAKFEAKVTYEPKGRQK